LILLLTILSSLRVSKTPPAAPEIFFGRENYVAQVITLIQTVKPARLAIMGPGGMGKTATALTVLSHESIKAIFSESRYFVPCEAATTPALLVNTILQVLDAQHIGRDVLTTLHQKLELIGPALLVLDNFETPWDESGMQSQIADVLARIAAVQHVTLIVTMRGTIHPSGIKWTHTNHSGLQKLGPLSEDDAKSLFLAINPTPLTSSEGTALSHLLKEMDYIPLAIVIMAQVGSGQSCSHLLKRWRREHLSLLQMQGSRSDKMTSVEVSIAMSLHSLSITENPEAIELLSVLSHLPDGLLSWEDNLDSVATSFEQPHHLVAVLLRTALAYIQVDNNGTLRVLSPIRHYILKKHPANPSRLLALETFHENLILKYAGVPIGSDYPTAVQRLSPEIGNINSVLMNALQHHPSEKFIRMGYVMSKFLRKVHPSLDIPEQLLRHPQLSKEAKLEIKCHRLYGKTLFSLSKYEEGRIIIEKCKTQFKEAGDVKRAASCMFYIAFAHYAMDNHAESEEICHLAFQQYEQIGYVKGMARSLLLLGEIKVFQSHAQEAQEFLKKSQELFLQIGDRKGIAQCQLITGSILDMEGQFPEACKMVEKAQETFVEFGDRNGEATCLRILGGLLQSYLQFDEAEKKLEQAKLLYTQVGNMHGTAACLFELADNLRLREKFPEAKEKTEQSLLQMECMGQRAGIASCFQRLGFIYCEMHDHNKAKEVLDKAKHMFKALGEVQGAATSLQALSLILKKEGKYDEALQVVSAAHEEFVQAGAAHGQFRTLWIKAEILQKQGQYDKAIKTLESVQHFFEQSQSVIGIAGCLLLKAQAFSDQKNYLEAEKLIEQCQLIFKDAGNEKGIAGTFNAFAEVSYEQGLYQNAKEKLKDAQEIYQRLEKSDGTAECLMLLSKILTREGQHFEAEKALAEAQKIFIEIGKEKEVAACLMVMGENWYSQGNLQDAKDKLEETQKLYDKMNDGEGAAECQKTLDKIKQTCVEKKSECVRQQSE
jgi:tetratricopeptide (TPR) repeat protein